MGCIQLKLDDLFTIVSMCLTLPKEVEIMNQSHLVGKLFLQHDEATPYTTAATSTAIQSIIFEVIPCPPYSTDLTLSVFWLF
jgi:hypothetical protein